MSLKFELYKINSDIESCFDPETGEIDNERLDALAIAREEKLEQLCLMVKNFSADAAAIKAEKQALESRQKAAEAEAEKIREIVRRELCGEPLKTAKVNVSWRSTQKVDVLNIKEVPTEFLRFSEPTVDKNAVKKAVKAGQEIPGCVVVEDYSLTIK